MTVALGIKCMDGMVLCADSLETDGVMKRMVSKIWRYEVQAADFNEWGIAVASAGEADLAETFNDSLRGILGNSDFDEAQLLAKVRAALRDVRLTYPEAQFEFLAIAYGNPDLYSKMFRVMGGSSHLGPVPRYQAIGIGGGLANFLASYLHTPSICVAEAARLGVFILSQVKDHVDGCGGPTSLMTFGGIGDNTAPNNKTFQFREWNRAEIDAIEADITGEVFRSAMVRFWDENNPPSRFARAVIPEGGRSRGVITTKLNTIP